MRYGANANNGSVAAAKSTLEQLRESRDGEGRGVSKPGWGYYLFLRAGHATGRPTAYEGKYGFLFESTRGYFAELYAYCWMETRKRFPTYFNRGPGEKSKSSSKEIGRGQSFLKRSVMHHSTSEQGFIPRLRGGWNPKCRNRILRIQGSYRVLLSDLTMR